MEVNFLKARDKFSMICVLCNLMDSNIELVRTGRGLIDSFYLEPVKKCANKGFAVNS
jgi:hypothetical protein